MERKMDSHYFINGPLTEEEYEAQEAEKEALEYFKSQKSKRGTRRFKTKIKHIKRHSDWLTNYASSRFSGKYLNLKLHKEESKTGVVFNGKGFRLGIFYHSRKNETPTRGTIGRGKNPCCCFFCLPWRIKKSMLINRSKAESIKKELQHLSELSDFTEELPESEVVVEKETESENGGNLPCSVGQEVLNEVDAVEMCKKIIPTSDDPFWSNSAREVLLAIFLKLQKEKGINWSWKDVYTEIRDTDLLKNTVITFNPILGTLFKEPHNKMAQEILTKLVTFNLTIRLLNQYERDLIYSNSHTIFKE